LSPASGKITVASARSYISAMKNPSAIKNDLFDPHQRAEKSDHFGDALALFESGRVN